MKYKYRVEFINIGGDKSFVFRLPEELWVVEIFLNSDIQCEITGRKVIDYCRQVQNGKLKEKTFTGNNCSITIKADYVQIIDRYAYDGNNICIIETSELEMLIEAFINEKEKNNF